MIHNGRSVHVGRCFFLITLCSHKESANSYAYPESKYYQRLPPEDAVAFVTPIELSHLRSKHITEMPRLQVPEKGPRKRRSTTAIREDEESRKKIVHVPEGAAGREGEEEIDMSDIMAEIKEIGQARRTDEQRARDDGMRVEKQARMRPRPLCCACGKQPGLKSDGTCACGHSRCPECMILESEGT